MWALSTTRASAALTIVPIAVAIAALAPAQPPTYDLVIRNGRIVDGTGSPWYRGDLAVRGDVIALMARRIDEPAARMIDAKGDVVAPGFIDLHTHALDDILEVPTADNYIRQGVTTLIGSPDGRSPIPLKPLLDRIAAARIAPNVGSFVGQGSVREAVVGLVNRAATPADLEQMRGLVRQAMVDGAFGLSTGLFYVPGTFTPTAEIVELAKVAGSLGGIHISHMRDEASRVLDSVRETIEIGEQGGLPTQVTHHKVIGTANWGRSIETLRLIDEARARGVDATLDVYPYTASSTNIASALLPAWALEGGASETLARLREPATRAKMKAEAVRLLRDERGGGDPQNVQLARCEWDTSLAGKRLGDLTRDRGREPSLENAADTVLWIVEQGNCTGIFHAMDERDLQRILRHPASMIASDGGLQVFGRGSPHPRSYGTFVRVLARYVRELRILSLEEAVRKMSAFPAQRAGLTDRGVLREGLKADIVVFDPERVRDLATFERPHQYPEGVSYVVVSGQLVVDAGQLTSARPGRVLHANRRHATVN
jgi:dihydroorotase/N-acyl-D-amino-acid deacylase